MQNGAAGENMKVKREKKKGKRKKGLKSHLLGNKLENNDGGIKMPNIYIPALGCSRMLNRILSLHTKIYKCLCIHSLIC